MPAGVEVDTSFAATQGRLDANGYRQVKMIGSDPYHLSAFDPQGSEVLLHINPQTGEIGEANYVHHVDR